MAIWVLLITSRIKILSMIMKHPGPWKSVSISALFDFGSNGIIANFCKDLRPANGRRARKGSLDEHLWSQTRGRDLATLGET
jgi:hypothetical protein